MSGERFSPIRFSLTGADSNFGVLAAKHVRRAAKRKTLFIIACCGRRLLSDGPCQPRGDVREKDQTRQHFRQTRAVGALFLSMTIEYSQAVYALLFGEVRGISSTDLAPVAAVSAISVALAALLSLPASAEFHIL